MKVLISDSHAEGFEGWFDISVSDDEGQVFESECRPSSMVEDRAEQLSSCYDAEIKWDIKGLE